VVSALRGVRVHRHEPCCSGRPLSSGVYVRNLASRATLLASAGHRSAERPSIDGRCRYVAFEAGILVLVRDLHARRTLRVGRGSEPDLQTDGAGIAYARGGQVYYQALQLTGRGLRKRGAERLASAGRAGAPATGSAAVQAWTIMATT